MLHCNDGRHKQYLSKYFVKIRTYYLPFHFKTTEGAIVDLRPHTGISRERGEINISLQLTKMIISEIDWGQSFQVIPKLSDESKVSHRILETFCTNLLVSLLPNVLRKYNYKIPCRKNSMTKNAYPGPSCVPSLFIMEKWTKSVKREVWTYFVTGIYYLLSY